MYELSATNYKSFFMIITEKTVFFVDKNIKELEKLYGTADKNLFYSMIFTNALSGIYIYDNSISKDIYNIITKNTEDTPLVVIQKFFNRIINHIISYGRFPKDPVINTVCEKIYIKFSENYNNNISTVVENYEFNDFDDFSDNLLNSVYAENPENVPYFSIFISFCLFNYNTDIKDCVLKIFSKAYNGYGKEKNKDFYKNENALLKEENKRLKSALKYVYKKLENVSK